MYTPMIRDMISDDKPRERLIKVGAKAVSTAELLAIILRVGGRGESVLRLAERLLAHFGSLAGLSRASINELQTVKGIGPAKAVEIKAALELGRRLVATSPEERPSINSPADAANLLMSDMMLLEQEHLRVILLDVRNKLIRVAPVYVGTLNSSHMRVGELFRAAIKENAASVIIIHNHPSGDPTPSSEDIKVTRQLIDAGDLLNISVLDHVIIGHRRFVSLKERNLAF